MGRTESDPRIGPTPQVRAAVDALALSEPSASAPVSQVRRPARVAAVHRRPATGAQRNDVMGPARRRAVRPTRTMSKWPWLGLVLAVWWRLSQAQSTDSSPRLYGTYNVNRSATLPPPSKPTPTKTTRFPTANGGHWVCRRHWFRPIGSGSVSERVFCDVVGPSFVLFFFYRRLEQQPTPWPTRVKRVGRIFCSVDFFEEELAAVSRSNRWP